MAGFREYSQRGFVRGIAGWGGCLLRSWQLFILMCSSLAYLCRELRLAPVSIGCSVRELDSRKRRFWGVSL